MALKRTGFGVYEVTVSRLCGKIMVDVPFPLHIHAAVFATGFINDALRNTVPSVYEPLRQLVNAMFWFLCNVRSCRNITKVRWQLMYAFNS